MLIVPELTNISSINKFMEFYRNLHNELPYEILSTNGNQYKTKLFLLEIILTLRMLRPYGNFYIKMTTIKNNLEQSIINILKKCFLHYNTDNSLYKFKYYKGVSSHIIDRLSMIFVTYNTKYTSNKKLNL